MSYRNESHCKNCRKLASTIDLSQVRLERRVLNQVKRSRGNDFSAEQLGYERPREALHLLKSGQVLLVDLHAQNARQSRIQ
jgi:hypothetical protein